MPVIKNVVFFNFFLGFDRRKFSQLSNRKIPVFFDAKIARNFLSSFQDQKEQAFDINYTGKILSRLPRKRILFI